LSPFARQTQVKKKDKFKSLRGKNKIKPEPEQDKQQMLDTSSNVSTTNNQPEQRENVNPHKPTVSSNETKTVYPVGLQEVAVNSKSDDKSSSEPSTGQVLSKFSSVTALITGALSGMGTSKAKTVTDLAKTSQPDEPARQLPAEPLAESCASQVPPAVSSESGSVAQQTTHTEGEHQESLTADSSAVDQSHVAGDAEPDSTIQPLAEVSAPVKKAKKNKPRKKKPKAKIHIEPVCPEDISSTETLAHQTPEGSPARLCPSNRTTNIYRASNMLDQTLSSLNLREGSVITLGTNGIGYQASRAVIVEDNVLHGTSDAVEESRRKMQAMEDKERMLKQRKG
jgi:hypothetical protein